MSSNARASGMPSSSAGKEVGDIVQTPDAPIKSWRYLGGGKWEPNDVVRFTETSPGGVVRLAAGADAPAVPLLLQSRSLAFIGDSRARYGYETWYRTAAKVTATAGFRVDLMGCGPSAPSSGQGLVEWRASDRMLRWTAPGDTPGPWTPFVGAREYKLESGSPRLWLRARWTSAVAPAADASFAVALSGDGRVKTTITGTSSAIAALLNLHITRPAYMGAGGAHTADCVEMLPWYAEQAGGDGIDVIRVGANDISAFIRTIPETIALAYQLFDARRALGRRLVICGEGARWDQAATGDTPMTEGRLAMLHALNAAYRDYALRNVATCRYVDLFDISYDPAHADGRPLADILSDGVHETASGVALYAAAIAPAVRELGIANDPPLSAADSVLGVQSLMTGTGGVVGANTTGVVPTKWQVRSVAGAPATVASIVPAGDGRAGQRVECSVTNGGSPGTVEVRANTPSVFTRELLGVAVGDALEICADVEVVSGTLTSIEGMIYIDGAARRGQVFFPVTPGTRSIRCSVPIEILPTDNNAITPQFYFALPASASAVFRIGNICVRKAVAP